MKMRNYFFVQGILLSLYMGCVILFNFLFEGDFASTVAAGLSHGDPSQSVSTVTVACAGLLLSALVQYSISVWHMLVRVVQYRKGFWLWLGFFLAGQVTFIVIPLVIGLMLLALGIKAKGDALTEVMFVLIAAVYLYGAVLIAAMTFKKVARMPVDSECKRSVAKLGAWFLIFQFSAAAACALGQLVVMAAIEAIAIAVVIKLSRQRDRQVARDTSDGVTLPQTV
jgi:hypothetical protein